MSEQRKYNDKIFKVDKDGKRIDKKETEKILEEKKNTIPDFQEEQDLIQNLYEAVEQKDEKLKLCLEKAIDSKNAWNVIHSNGEISKQNKVLQILMIILTFFVALGTIIQIFQK